MQRFLKFIISNPLLGPVVGLYFTPSVFIRTPPACCHLSVVGEGDCIPRWPR